MILNLKEGEIMAIEIGITLLIIAAAGIIFVRDIKNKSKSKCNCGSCSNHCPMYDAKKH